MRSTAPLLLPIALLFVALVLAAACGKSDERVQLESQRKKAKVAEMAEAISTGIVAPDDKKVPGTVQKKSSPAVDSVNFEGRTLKAPPGFELRLVQNPPVEQLSATKGASRCDFGILLGHKSPEERARLVKAMQSNYPGDKVPIERVAGGEKLVGMAVPAMNIKLYSAQLGTDLLSVSFQGEEADECGPLLDELVLALKSAGTR